MPGVAGVSSPPSLNCVGDVQPSVVTTSEKVPKVLMGGGARLGKMSHHDRHWPRLTSDYQQLRGDVDSCATCAPGRLTRPNNEPLLSSGAAMSTNLRIL